MTVNGQDGGVQSQVGSQRSAFDDPGLRTAIFAAIAAIVGLGAGYLLDIRERLSTQSWPIPSSSNWSRPSGS